jgi:hypothetical protein
VDAATDEQVARQCPGGRVLHHLVDLEFVVAGAGLEEEVVRQILDQVARGEDVVAVPGPTLRVLRQRALASSEEMVRVADALHAGQRRSWASAVPVPLRCGAGQHGVDRGGDQLDVPELLGGDVGEEVVEGPRPLTVAEVE